MYTWHGHQTAQTKTYPTDLLLVTVCEVAACEYVLTRKGLLLVDCYVQRFFRQHDIYKEGNFLGKCFELFLLACLFAPGSSVTHFDHPLLPSQPRSPVPTAYTAFASQLPYIPTAATRNCLLISAFFWQITGSLTRAHGHRHEGFLLSRGGCSLGFCEHFTVR